MTSEQQALIELVRTTMHKTPDMAIPLMEAMQMGLKESVRIQAEKAADMETVASMALHTKLFKGNEKFIAQKLRKWGDLGLTSLRWDDVLAKLDTIKG